MEIKSLRYFLTIARMENMTKASEILHVTQPTLSKALKELEEELGKKLFLRKSTKMVLTEEGLLLKKRAEDIVGMTDKTIGEFKTLSDLTGGDVYLGCAESYQIRYLAKALKKVRETCPNIHFHMFSGDTEHVAEKLDKGLLDLAVFVENPDMSKYNVVRVPETDSFGAVVLNNHPLNRLKSVSFNDLKNYPLICSEQCFHKDLPRWCGEKRDELDIIGFNTLPYNGTAFVRENMAVMLTFDKLLYCGKDSEFSFIPLNPPLECPFYFVWRKYQAFTPVAALLLDCIKQTVCS